MADAFKLPAATEAIADDDCLLPDDDPTVLELYNKLHAQFHHRFKTAKDANRSLDTGLGWKACFIKHQEAREYLKVAFRKKAGGGGAKLNASLQSFHILQPPQIS
jgi:hypothetical protein